MITYRMMDDTCLLPACLHRGPIPLASLHNVETTATAIEEQEGIAPGTLARFLRALCERYGSCAVLAVDGHLVVGKLRFAPAQVEEMLSGICLQVAEAARRIADLDLAALPARDDLANQALRLDCYQVAEGYRGQRIAKQMLETVIHWARAAGWQALSSTAIRHIPPLLNWSGQASLKALQQHGFTIISQHVNPDLREGVVSQRLGYHGDKVKHQWEAFADISDEEAAVLYQLLLALKGRAEER
ncbi:MAG: GNAT family N-acetyltransferase [Armatimonadota bacterium]|nr:MAG: GNAT family N-acetyltransferase [Armatimonadota bacterium]